MSRTRPAMQEKKKKNSWSLDSVSGAIIIYKECYIKFFSRKQKVPVLSSAKTEIISIVETAKEMVSIGMLLQTVIQRIPP